MVRQGAGSQNKLVDEPSTVKTSSLEILFILSIKWQNQGSILWGGQTDVYGE